jgi:hypothetical protein
VEFDVTVRVTADSATEAIDIVQGSEFFYERAPIMSVVPVKVD